MEAKYEHRPEGLSSADVVDLTLCKAQAQLGNPPFPFPTCGPRVEYSHLRWAPRSTLHPLPFNPFHVPLTFSLYLHGAYERACVCVCVRERRRVGGGMVAALVVLTRVALLCIISLLRVQSHGHTLAYLLAPCSLERVSSVFEGPPTRFNKMTLPNGCGRYRMEHLLGRSHPFFFIPTFQPMLCRHCTPHDFPKLAHWMILKFGKSRKMAKK